LLVGFEAKISTPRWGLKQKRQAGPRNSEVFFDYLFVLEKMMKKFVCILAIVALTAPMFAEDITVTATPDTGKITIGYTSDVADATTLPVGIALDVMVADGSIVGLESYDQTEYPIYLDYANSEELDPAEAYELGEGHPLAASATDPGAADIDALDADMVVICMGRLEAEEASRPGPAAVANLVTLLIACDEGMDATVTVGLNDKRGGIVSAAVGTELTVALPDAKVVSCDAGGCDCLGDLDGDGWISPLDVSEMVTRLTPHADVFYWIDSTNPDYRLCGDLDEDGWMSPLDYSELINVLTPYADDFYWKQCD